MTDTVSSAPPESMAAAVVAALGELTEIRTDEEADTGQYRYRYATLAGIMRTVRPVLAAHGLGVSQRLAGDEGTVAVQTVLTHSSGAEHASGWLVVRAPPNAQQIGSWVSYLRRYQLVALLGLAVEDDDGKHATAPPSQQQQGAPLPSHTGPLRPQQRTLILTLFGQLGMEGADNRDARLALTSEVLGRDIESTNEVTPIEASALIAHLRARVARMEEDMTGG